MSKLIKYKVQKEKKINTIKSIENNALEMEKEIEQNVQEKYIAGDISKIHYKRKISVKINHWF